MPALAGAAAPAVCSFQRAAAPPAAARHCRRASRRTALRVAADSLTDALKLESCKPLGKRILLVPAEKEQKTAGGILLPSSADAKAGNFIAGEVVGVGEECTLCTKGQHILVSGYGGTEVDFQGRKAKFVYESEVLAVLS